MTDKSIYNSIIQAKNGTNIPVFISGKTVESRYNPENSCDIILNTINKQSFFVVTGIASGILIKNLAEKFPTTQIIAFENSQKDIDFLMQLENVNQCSKYSNVTFCTLSELSNTIISKYLPAKYGDFQLIQQKPWLQEQPQITELLPDLINNCLKQISADYSVQCHFGKRWQKNIITNLKLVDKKEFNPQNFDTSKTAAIIAAGPSLDSTIQELKTNRNDYVIFSTDTAYSTLIKNHIYPEVVVSIDGQLISYNHFFEKSPDTHFYFDLCGNSSALKSLSKKSDNFHIFVSGHPFCNLVNQFTNNSIPFIYNGSGTVTISSVDLALKSGFSKLKIFGADFAYLKGKAYTKGTYLDSLYSKPSFRLKTLETTFDKLIFRVPLKALGGNSYTTEVLESYKSSLENYLKENNCSFKIINNCYLIQTSSSLQNEQKDFSINYKAFIKSLSNYNDYDLQTSLLPLIAYLRKNKPNEEYVNLLKLARTFVVSYN